MTALEIKLAIGAAVLAVALAAFGWYHHRVLLEGEAKIEAADQRAARSLKTLTDAQTQHAKELATQAEMDTAHEQKTLDNYALTHPLGPVRVCVAANNSGGGMPKARPPIGGAQSPGPGSNVVPPVSAGPDIGPGLLDLVQTAARLAEIDREWQQR